MFVWMSIISSKIELLYYFVFKSSDLFATITTPWRLIFTFILFYALKYIEDDLYLCFELLSSLFFTLKIISYIDLISIISNHISSVENLNLARTHDDTSSLTFSIINYVITYQFTSFVNLIKNSNSIY